MRSQPENNSGFTLIELMVTVAIAAIIMGVAIPNFTSIITSNRLTANANELVTALNLARSEAVKRGVQVTVSRKGNTSAEWKYGWDVFIDQNNNSTYEAAADTLLRTYDPLPGDYTLRTGNSAYKDYAAYTPSGLSKSALGDTFKLCPGSGTSVKHRTIILSTTGRPRVETPTGTCP